MVEAISLTDLAKERYLKRPKTESGPITDKYLDKTLESKRDDKYSYSRTSIEMGES